MTCQRATELIDQYGGETSIPSPTKAPSSLPIWPTAKGARKSPRAYEGFIRFYGPTIFQNLRTLVLS